MKTWLAVIVVSLGGMALALCGVALSPCGLLHAEEDTVERQAYLAKRAAEKAAAELAVKELTVNEDAQLTPDDFIRLALAYNELGDNRLALEAIGKVKDEVLAAKKQLELKAICFQNMSHGEDKTILTRQLAFIDRCLDRRWGNQGVWIWRKAKVVCQASVRLELPTRGDQIGSPAAIVDKEQFEYSFELLKQAFQAEPHLYRIGGLGPSFMWESDFPLLHEEPRFKELMKAHEVK